MAIEATPAQYTAPEFPDLGDAVMFPRLSEAKVAKFAKHGERRSYAEGETLYAQGERDAPFFVIERGRVKLLDRKPGKDIWIAEADAGTFLGDIATFTGEPAIAEAVAGEPTDVVMFEREELRSMLAVVAGDGRGHAAHDDGPPRVARGERLRRPAADRPARFAARLRGARPARAQPDPDALVRRRHRRRQRGDAQVAPDPARGDARARPRHRGAAQPVGRPGRARPRPAGGDRRRAVRPRRARRRPRGARGRGLRRLGGPADARDRGLGARRPGRDEHPDRELHRLPDRHLRHRADAQGHAAGAPLRRGAVELPPRGRARARPRGPRPCRPRRRPARARPHRRRRDRRALAPAPGRERRPLHRRRRLPRRDGVATPSAAATRT